MRLKHDDYTIAWICALPLEMTAAKAMLDTSHPFIALGNKRLMVIHSEVLTVMILCWPLYRPVFMEQ